MRHRIDKELPSGSVSSVELDCIRRVRECIRQTYPLVDVAGIIEIAVELGLTRLPDAMFLTGDLDDETDGGLGARLAAVSDPSRVRWANPHPLFSTLFYDFLYPSVREQGISPWMHYHVFGYVDGLSPHFLLDVNYLRQSMPTVSKKDLIDRYLTDRRVWFLSSSPYADNERFVMSGAWDRENHPLVHIISSRQEWLQPRLMMVDSAWGANEQARINGAGLLLTLGRGVSGDSRVRTWVAGADTSPVEGEISTVVVPGYFVGQSGHEVSRLSDAALSPDQSVLRLGDELLSLDSNNDAAADHLVVIGSPLGRVRLEELAGDTGRSLAIAPFNRSQQAALHRLVAIRGLKKVRILEWGVQAHVESGSLSTEKQPIVADPRWTWDDSVAPESTVFVIADSKTSQLTDDSPLTNWLERGATLCIVVDGHAIDWVIALQRGAAVVSDDESLEAVRPFVDAHRMYRLASGTELD